MYWLILTVFFRGEVLIEKIPVEAPILEHISNSARAERELRYCDEKAVEWMRGMKALDVSATAVCAKGAV